MVAEEAFSVTVHSVQEAIMPIIDVLTIPFQLKIKKTVIICHHPAKATLYPMNIGWRASGA